MNGLNKNLTSGGLGIGQSYNKMFGSNNKGLGDFGPLIQAALAARKGASEIEEEEKLSWMGKEAREREKLGIESEIRGLSAQKSPIGMNSGILNQQRFSRLGELKSQLSSLNRYK